MEFMVLTPMLRRNSHLEEPYAGNSLVRVCGGLGPQGPSLPGIMNWFDPYGSVMRPGRVMHVLCRFKEVGSLVIITVYEKE